MNGVSAAAGECAVDLYCSPSATMNPPRKRMISWPELQTSFCVGGADAPASGWSEMARTRENHQTVAGKPRRDGLGAPTGESSPSEDPPFKHSQFEASRPDSWMSKMVVMTWISVPIGLQTP